MGCGSSSDQPARQRGRATRSTYNRTEHDLTPSIEEDLDCHHQHLYDQCSRSSSAGGEHTVESPLRTRMNMKVKTMVASFRHGINDQVDQFVPLPAEELSETQLHRIQYFLDEHFCEMMQLSTCSTSSTNNNQLTNGGVPSGIFSEPTSPVNGGGGSGGSGRPMGGSPTAPSSRQFTAPPSPVISRANSSNNFLSPNGVESPTTRTSRRGSALIDEETAKQSTDFASAVGALVRGTRDSEEASATALYEELAEGSQPGNPSPDGEKRVELVSGVANQQGEDAGGVSVNLFSADGMTSGWGSQLFSPNRSLNNSPMPSRGGIVWVNENQQDDVYESNSYDSMLTDSNIRKWKMIMKGGNNSNTVPHSPKRVRGGSSSSSTPVSVGGYQTQEPSDAWKQQHLEEYDVYCRLSQTGQMSRHFETRAKGALYHEELFTGILEWFKSQPLAQLRGSATTVLRTPQSATATSSGFNRSMDSACHKRIAAPGTTTSTSVTESTSSSLVLDDGSLKANGGGAAPGVSDVNSLKSTVLITDNGSSQGRLALAKSSNSAAGLLSPNTPSQSSGTNPSSNSPLPNAMTMSGLTRSAHSRAQSQRRRMEGLNLNPCGSTRASMSAESAIIELMDTSNGHKGASLFHCPSGSGTPVIRSANNSQTGALWSPSTPTGQQSGPNGGRFPSTITSPPPPRPITDRPRGKSNNNTTAGDPSLHSPIEH